MDHLSTDNKVLIAYTCSRCKFPETYVEIPAPKEYSKAWMKTVAGIVWQKAMVNRLLYLFKQKHYSVRIAVCDVPCLKIREPSSEEEIEYYQKKQEAIKRGIV